MNRRLLVPLDGSYLAEVVLPIAQALGRRLHMTLVLLHVVERGAPRAVHGERHLGSVEEAEVYLAEIGNKLKASGCKVEVHVHEVAVGDVAESIAAHSVEHSTEMILLSTHGAGGVREALWGSIAQQVLHRSSKPTLLAQARTRGEWEDFEPKTIMVPLDGTAGAEGALPLAGMLARGLRAEVRLVMVVATLETLKGEQVPTATFLPGSTRVVLADEVRQATTYLEELAESLRAELVPAVVEIRRGSTVHQLADDAAEHEDGLVVVATHGRAGLQAVWSSSVAARLLRRTRMPVLLVPIVEERT